MSHHPNRVQQCNGQLEWVGLEGRRRATNALRYMEINESARFPDCLGKVTKVWWAGVLSAASHCLGNGGKPGPLETILNARHAS